MRHVSVFISVCAMLAFAPAAMAQQHVELVDGRLAFDIPTQFKRTEEPGYSLYLEPAAEDASWMKCSVKILPAPTFGTDQAAANARVRQLPFMRTVGSGKLLKGWYVDHGDITARALTFEVQPETPDDPEVTIDMRQVYLINGLFLLTIQADCIWPNGFDDSSFEIGQTFLGSMKINGH